jgi:1,4-dihydroxy-2-naphthoate polyprenyltransferase
MPFEVVLRRTGSCRFPNWLPWTNLFRLAFGEWWGYKRNPMAKVEAYLGVARAPFLLLPITLVASGAMAAYYAGKFSWLNTILALIGLIALHACVNAFNEVSDMKSGIDLRTQRTPFSGGSGTLPAGLLSTHKAYVFAVALALLGLAIGLYFLRFVGLAFLPILILGAVCVLAYANLFSHSGVGEIAAGVGLGLLPVMGSAMVQGVRLPVAAVAAGIPAFFMTFNLLLLNEFPDEMADRTGGRRHLVILMGRRGAALIYSAAALLTPLSIAVAVWIGSLPKETLIALLPSILLLMPLKWAFTSPAKPVSVGAMAANVIWNLLTNIALASALFWAA